MIHRQILTCLFLVALIPLTTEAFPPASPAGGNYLVLDGDDDHAVLDFETFGRPLPNGTAEFTVEAWVYPTTPPDNGNTLLTILHQQVHMLIVNDEFQPWLNEVANLQNVEPPKGNLILIMNAYIDGKFGLRLTFPIPLKQNQWHHIAYQSDGDQTTMIVNDFVWIRPLGDPLGHDKDPRALRPKDFMLGGFGKIIQVDGSFWGSFTGYIDEVRISTEARYDVKKKDFMPDGKFKNDAKTVALWHFDEPSGTREFSDASGNAYHLGGHRWGEDWYTTRSRTPRKTYDDMGTTQTMKTRTAIYNETHSFFFFNEKSDKWDTVNPDMPLFDPTNSIQ